MLTDIQKAEIKDAVELGIISQREGFLLLRALKEGRYEEIDRLRKELEGRRLNVLPV